MACNSFTPGCGCEFCSELRSQYHESWDEGSILAAETHKDGKHIEPSKNYGLFGYIHGEEAGRKMAKFIGVGFKERQEELQKRMDSYFADLPTIPPDQAIEELEEKWKTK